jgi:thiol peroxidase
MNQTKFKGNPVKLNGSLPAVGQVAPDFTFVKEDLSEGHLKDYKGEVKVIIAVPSLDTGVCQMETRQFNQRLDGMKGVKGIVVSKDLPFAMKRFCTTEGIESVVIASDFRGDFSTQYHTLMEDGPLKGLSARATFVVDKNDNIVHVDLTDDITQEPDYEQVMKAVERVL